jgi:hypothetical protein
LQGSASMGGHQQFRQLQQQQMRTEARSELQQQLRLRQLQQEQQALTESLSELRSRSQQQMMPYMSSQHWQQQQISHLQSDVEEPSFDTMSPLEQLMLQQQRERLYHDNFVTMYASQNAFEPLLQQQDDFLDAIDSVLGPLDPDSSHFENVSLPPQPQAFPTSATSGPTSLEQAISHQFRTVQQVETPQQSQPFNGPDDLADERKRPPSQSPTNIDQSRTSDRTS